MPAKGLEQLLSTVSKVKRQINPKLQIDGILLTMVDNRTNFAKEIAALLRETYGSKIKVFGTEIPHSVRAKEISAEGKSIFAHDPNGKVAEGYKSLTKEVLRLEKQREKSRAGSIALLIVRLIISKSDKQFRGPDVGSSMTIGGREVQEDFVGTLATQVGLVAVLADGMGKTFGARIASRTAVETFLDLFRDYNAFDNPQYYFRKSFHAANRSILCELGDEGYGAASVGAAMIQGNWLFYAVVGNVKLCVFRNGDLVPVSTGHTLDVLAEQTFRTGKLSREDALVMLEHHRLYNYLGQDSFKDIEIFDRPISLQKDDIVVLMSDGLYELISWKDIETVLSSGQDCQSMAYALMEKVNQNHAEEKDNASVILLRWDGSTT